MNSDDVFDGYENASLKKLGEMIQRGQLERRAALDSGDLVRAQQIREQGNQAIERHQRLLMSKRRFACVCPLEWLHEASWEACQRAVRSPRLWRAVALEPDPTGKWFVLLGETGLGKSSALGIALRRAASQGYLDPTVDREGYAALWVQARDVGRAMREHPLGRGLPPLLSEARIADLLIFDDLGLEGDHGEILDVLEERYQRGRVTWTTSGLSPSALVARYGDAFFRRIQGGGVEGRGALVDCTEDA